MGNYKFKGSQAPLPPPLLTSSSALFVLLPPPPPATHDLELELSLSFSVTFMQTACPPCGQSA